MDISPDEFRGGPKNPPCAFFLIQDGRHHVTPFSKKTGACHNSSLISVLFSIPKIQDDRHIDLLSMLSDLLKNENMR